MYCVSDTSLARFKQAKPRRHPLWLIAGRASLYLSSRLSGLPPAAAQVENWLVESFAGARHGERIYWDLSNPSRDADGQYRPGNADRPLTIRITDGKHLSGFEKLAVLVFEVAIRNLRHW